MIDKNSSLSGIYPILFNIGQVILRLADGANFLIGWRIAAGAPRPKQEVCIARKSSRRAHLQNFA